jgi:hypothetical protein
MAEVAFVGFMFLSRCINLVDSYLAEFYTLIFLKIYTSNINMYYRSKSVRPFQSEYLRLGRSNWSY